MQQTTWNKEKINELFTEPFFELIYKAYTCHKKNFSIKEMEFCALSNIKTGGCTENCGYCAQSKHFNTNVKEEKLLDIDSVVAQAQNAKTNGAKRFCMGAAWANPSENDFSTVLTIIKKIKNISLETCATLGMLTQKQAKELKDAGLDFYNHNLDTSRSYYKKIISTRTYDERLQTIKHIVDAGINVCCGGIFGMGETRTDRIELLLALQQLPKLPASIPINELIPIANTPLANSEPINEFELIKTIAVTRLMFPSSRIRLAAGREKMSNVMQAWCFIAGANSIFIGEKLLTAQNPQINSDIQLLETLGINAPHVQT